ncbi:amidohydrolase [Herbiconiux sp. L3-i23]|uniref:amidohydrolase n=1 Tax=Herbiconiux sp. L3-i23 TaxID=2905871 RepID=UPI00206F4DD8|nr:amidohydrolase family protein [Herbiconiux sp. L3-i23]BDI23902.1 amidohydrolase [Herbiconiux sp. L3-i23]
MREVIAYTGGRILPQDTAQPTASTLVVADGIVQSVGDDVPVPAGARRVDLDGATVVPGFIDAHVHPKMGGLQLIGGTLVGLAGVDGYWAALRTRLAVGGVDDWVVLPGYAAITMARSGSDRSTLDAIAGERPVILVNSDLHGGLVNSAVLRATGLEHGGGFPAELVDVGADGRATGYLNEEALSRALMRVPPVSDRVALEAVRAAQAHLHSLGIVGWQDAMLGDQHGDGDVTPQYVAMQADGSLTARVSGAIGWNRELGLEQIDRMIELRDSLTGGGVTAPAAKLFLDGVNEAGTAAMLHPYSDATGADHGEGPSLFERDLLLEAVTELDRRGLDVHMHAVGDRAVRDGLDAIAAARKANGRGRGRDQIAHAMFVSDADIARFRELDVTLNIQPVWAASDFLDFDRYEAMVGPAVMATLYRFETLGETGLRWSIGSDWPVSSPAPLDAITAGARRALHEPATTRPEWQALAAEIALRAYTQGSAHSSRLDRNGVLRPGMNADFVRLDGDPVDRDFANTITVLETVVGGRTVYRAD